MRVHPLAGHADCMDGDHIDGSRDCSKGLGLASATGGAKAADGAGRPNGRTISGPRGDIADRA